MAGLEPFPANWHKGVMRIENPGLGRENRDPGAVREMLNSHGDRLLRSAFLLCGSEPEAQDLVQETFLQALRSLPRFRGQSSVYTWLHGILLNLSRRSYREAKRIVYCEQFIEQAPAAPEEGPSPVDAEVSGSALAEALGRLSTPHREVLVLRFYEDMKIHEIARHLGLSTGTVKSRLHYAITKMQNLVPAEMNLFGPGGTEERKRL
jgi:RNA polymerase sigma-70 factor (ECF subfamily)